jgi:ankyrin repeat protein
MSSGVTSSSDRSEPTLPNLICNNASIEDVKSSLAETADIDVVDFKGWSGLHWALVREVDAVVALLLNSGANPNLPTGTGRIPLVIALRSGQADAVKLLLKAGADPNQADGDGRTAVEAAREGRFPELGELLDEWDATT